MPASSVASALSEVEEIFAGDAIRVDLVEGDLANGRIVVALDLSAVECLDCVLPAAVVADLVQSTVRDLLAAPDLVVVVEDPRTAAPAPVPEPEEMP